MQDANQQFMKYNQDLGIIHIIVENYVLDNIQYKFFPSEKKCTNFSIDVIFICFPKNLLKSFEKLFLKQQIYVTQFVCSNYIKTFDFINKEQNMCECAKDIVQGVNKQEVVSVSKKLKKKGFFEKLFHFFR